MKVAIVSREFPPDSTWGGVATGYYNLAKGLVQKGCEVHIICQAVGECRDYTDEGIFVHRVGTNPKRYSALGRINFSIYAWLKLRKIIRSCGIDVVETPYWSAEGFLYSFHKMTPLVVRSQSSAHESIETGTYSGKKEFMNLKVLAFLADVTAKKADRIVADSQVNYDRVIKLLNIDPQKIEVVYPATDAHRFKHLDSGIRNELGLADAPLIMHVGRLEAKKGIQNLLLTIPVILQKLPLSKFILIGRDTHNAPDGGSFKDYIMSIACDNNFSHSLIFFDFVPEDRLIQLYSACDLFVLPSLEESFGAVLIEAMACGKPAVATRTGIAIELETLGLKGLEVVPIDNISVLADAMVKMLLLSEQDKERVSMENRELVEKRFSLGVWVDKMISVYERVLYQRDGCKAGI